MSMRLPRLLLQISAVGTMFVWLGSVRAAEPDAKVMSYKLPKDIKWSGPPEGPMSAVISGDPTKPGLYAILVKWGPHQFSHPHYHPNDRIVTVISGTWWVGWGTKFDPATTYPLPAGSVATHLAKQIHWDGAKDVETVLEIVGMGPAPSIPAESK
jgi:hypothetical protein